jgi:thioredoxin-like negative regulator of GroEL
MVRFGVRGIPTLLVFRDGQLVDRVVGAAPYATVEARVLQHAAS